MKHNEQIQKRITTKGVQAGDIKHNGRLTELQIYGISKELAFMWVRSGDWKMKDFALWLKVQKEFNGLNKE